MVIHATTVPVQNVPFPQIVQNGQVNGFQSVKCLMLKIRPHAIFWFSNFGEKGNFLMECFWSESCSMFPTVFGFMRKAWSPKLPTNTIWWTHLLEHYQTVPENVLAGSQHKEMRSDGQALIRTKPILPTVYQKCVGIELFPGDLGRFTEDCFPLLVVIKYTGLWHKREHYEWSDTGKDSKQALTLWATYKQNKNLWKD